MDEKKVNRVIDMHTLAKRFACPVCDVDPGEQCKGVNEIHAERLLLGKRALEKEGRR